MKITNLERWLAAERKKLNTADDRIELTLLRLKQLKEDQARLRKSIGMLVSTIEKLKTK